MFGIRDKKENTNIIDPSYSLVDLLENYEKYAKLSLINNL